MGEDLAPGNMHQPLTEMNTQNLRPKSRELWSSLFGQVAATTVRNLIDDGVATLEKLDKMLVERVTQFTEQRKQLKMMRNEDERQHVLQLLEQHESLDGEIIQLNNWKDGEEIY